MTRKTPLLLLHGAMGSAHSFERVRPVLEPHFETHILNFEGHGERRDSGRPFTIEHFKENVLDYLSTEGLTGANIFGLSMGGYVGLLLASRHPEWVNRILTLGTKFDWTPESAAREASFLQPETLAEKAPKYAAQLEKTHTGAGWKHVAQQTQQMMIGLGNQPDINHQVLSGVLSKVRLMVGDKDSMVTISETAGAYRALPNAELAVLPDTLHPIERLQPEYLEFMAKNFFLRNHN